jgi:hypothetical protein
MVSTMEITKCTDNYQTTFQYFNYGYSKFCYSQSRYFFRAYTIKSPNDSEKYLFFNWISLLNIYFVGFLKNF